MMATTMRCQWLTDPRDGLTHAWRNVIAGGRWQALCDVVADPDTLTEPEDEFGRHVVCVLVLGTELADQHGDSAWHV